MRNNVLCLDISLSSTGYAVFDENSNLIEKGVIDTHLIKCQDKEHHGEKLLFIFNALNKLEHEYSFSLILQERSFIQHPTASKAIQKVLGVIELLFNKKEIILISPKTTKKFLCNADASKDDMIEAINFNYDLNLNNKNKGDNDIADAIALYHYYINNKEKAKGVI